MDPIREFWGITAPKLAEKWPDTFKFISSAGRIYNEFYVKDRVGVYDDDLSTSKALALCHDIAEAIGVHVWAHHVQHNVGLAHWYAEWRINKNFRQWDVGCYDTAPLACLAALNAAVKEVSHA